MLVWGLIFVAVALVILVFGSCYMAMAIHGKNRILLWLDRFSGVSEQTPRFIDSTQHRAPPNYHEQCTARLAFQFVLVATGNTLLLCYTHIRELAFMYRNAFLFVCLLACLLLLFLFFFFVYSKMKFRFQQTTAVNALSCVCKIVTCILVFLVFTI